MIKSMPSISVNMPFKEKIVLSTDTKLKLRTLKASFNKDRDKDVSFDYVIRVLIKNYQGNNFD